jgi:heme-degrading monooxygenase HmoA
MIGRLWKTGLKPGCGAAYEKFARDVSMPMFRQQEGFLGCVMSRSAQEGSVLTFWQDQEAVDALAHSPSYQATVASIVEADMLAGSQTTEVMNVHLFDLDRVNPRR